MTIHKSKGLEFPVVFLANCSATPKHDYNKVKINRKLGIGTVRYFPNLYKDFPTLPSNTIKLFEDEEESAERIRALYVALTRAEEKLYIVGTLYNPEKKITDLYYDCYSNFVEPSVPLSLCYNFIQWILLALMNHPVLKNEQLLSCSKNLDSPKIDFQIFDKCDEINEVLYEDEVYECDKEVLNEINEKLSH
jgi:ATP-dependent helicase/nuclease subunit A